MAEKLTKQQVEEQPTGTFSTEVSINQHDLPFEWIRQPTTYHKYAVLHADAVLARDQAKDQLDLVQAQLDREVREAAVASNAKTTETSIRNQILEMEAYGTARDKLAKSEHTVNVLMAGVRALDHKKTALEFLSRLQMADFYSEPSIGQPAQKQAQVQEQRKQEAGLSNNPRIPRKK